MTVSSETRKAGPYACDGVDTTFDFAFKVFAAADVRVVLTTSAGVESDLTLNAVSSGFTVSLNADQDNDPGGTITTTEAHAAGNTITITSDVADTQGTQLPAGGGWSPRVVERALDRLTILVQQVRLLVAGALRQPVSDATVIGELPTKTARANKYLKFDADGDPEVDDSVVPETATVSAFMETVLDDTTAAAARTTLGAAGSGANTDITSVYLNNTGLKVKDTNASHGLSIVPGSNLTADRVLTVTTGDADRTLEVAGNATVSGTNTGDQTVPAAATQADQETASSTTTYVTPGRQHFHPGHPKAWALVTISGGTPTLVSSYNVSGITDNNVGDITITFTTALSSANYAVVASAQAGTGFCAGLSSSSTRSASNFRAVWIRPDSGAAVDPTEFSIAFYGDFA